MHNLRRKIRFVLGIWVSFYSNPKQNENLMAQTFWVLEHLPVNRRSI